MKFISKFIIILSILFNIFLFAIYFWALYDKIQNPGYKNLPFKDYMCIGIVLIVFAIINTIFTEKFLKRNNETIIKTNTSSYFFCNSYC